DYVQQNRTSFYQDVDIWSTKRPVDNPVLAEGDGPIYQLREWYAQFYTDEADLPAETKELREFITVDNR
ncbi:MAG TPA: 3-ketosteroid-9-alpha-hydroxylase, partial [Candidatus Pseudomonas excrementavium]|nr:3-ketosteroid-9-alpha-hydroxylase [Candidatus Pseudomonas excrementavium]